MLTLWLLLLWLGNVYPEAQGQNPFVCPSEWGVFPHPDNHTRFFRCVGGRAIMNTCASGVFVPARGNCLVIEQSGQRTEEPVSNYSTTTSFSDVRSSTPLFSNALTASPDDQTEPAPSSSGASSIMTSGINFSTKSENSSGISVSSSTAVTPRLSPRQFPERKSENTDNDEEKSGMSPTTSSAIDEEHPGSWGDNGEPTTRKSIFDTDSISSRVQKTQTTAKSPHKTVPGSVQYYVKNSSQDSKKYGKKTESKDDENLLNDSKKYDKRTASKDGEDMLINPKKYGKRTASKVDENLLIYSKTHDSEATSDESFLCPEESGFFPHHTNCTRFFWCVHWKPSAMVCGAPGEWFDPDNHICSRIHGAEDCPGRQATPEHSHRQIGNRYDVASYVNHVVQDVRKKRSVLSGSRGHTGNVSKDDVNTSTSRIRRLGRHARQAEAPNTPKEELRTSQGTGNRRSSEDAPAATSLDLEAGTIPVFRCPRDGFHADPQDCSVFYHCSHGRAFRHKCQPGTSFHKDKLVCGWPLNKEGCGGKLNAPDTPTLPRNSENENLISDEFQCPDEMTGFYPHPEDCTVFFQCSEGKAFRQQCGPGTAFNQQQGVCSWPMKLDTGCGAILENTVDDHLPDHKVEDSGYKARNHRDRSGAEPVRDYNKKPVRAKTETFSKNLLKQVYPETTFETVSPIPRKLVSETSSDQLTRTTRSSFLIKDPLTNPRKINEEHLPTSDEDTIKSQNVPSNMDQNDKELLKTEKAKFQASKFISSDLEVDGGKWNKDLEITPDSTVSTNTESTFSVNHATTQSGLSDEDSEQKLGKLRSVKLAVAWPWERMKQKHSQEKRTAPENALISTEPNKQENTTKPSFSSMSSISYWYLSSTKKMLMSPSTPIVREGTRDGEPSTVPTTNMSATEPAMMASTEPRGEFRKVRAETYKVVAADTDFRCPFPTGHFRDPLNCAVYYRCIEGLAYRNDCPSGKLYDTHSHKCLVSSQVTNCWRADAAMMNGKRRMNDYSFKSGDPGKPYTPNDVTGFRCPKSHGLYRDPQDCRIFYRCSVGRPFRHECESGTVFSTERGLCAPSAIVPDCPEVTQKQQEVNSPRSSSTSHESAHTTRKNQPASSPDKNCHHQDDSPSTSYHTSRDVKGMGYDVRKGVQEERAEEKLQGDTEFEAEMDEDDWDPPNPLYVTPGNMPDEATDFTCPRHVFNHFFPDPVSCWRFHRCFRGRRFSFLCPPGTFYDAVRKLCDFQHKVPDCDPQGRRLPGSWTSSESAENEVDAWPVTDTVDNWDYNMPESSPKPYARPVSDDDDNREYMSQPSPNYLPSSKLCPQSDGLFAHPSSCRKFVYCSRGAPVVLTCPPDLLYNTDTMTCDYNDSIVCLRYDK